jgi:hypothetical protein
MKVTIDSSEPLEHAVRVLGAMYDVTLSVATEPSSPAATSKPANKAGTTRVPKRARAAKSTAAAVSTKRPLRGSKTTAKTAKTAAAQGVSSSELRSWARSNGYEVGSYGRVPAAVATAYREAHKS